MKEKVIGFIKKDTVLCVATTLAMVSAFFVKPTLNYVNYIDFRVLGILLSLMTVMAGLQRNGLFDMIGSSLLKRTKNTMQLSLVLVFLCFFFSMFITNDVSLITFVPFAMLTLRKCNQEKLLIPVIIVQTLAANLGSMLTPIGNPQNLYLYNLAEMKMSTFIGIIGPYTLASGILLLLSVAVVCRKKEKIEFTLEENNGDHEIEKERLHLRRKTHQKKCSLSDFISDESACRCESIAVLCSFHCCVCDGLYNGQTSVENGRLQFNSHIYRFFHFYWEYRRN